MGQEKGNCSFQKNPTPCIIPQEQENIFHTIFAFFTKSGRKVLVRICLVAGVTWVVLTRKASLRLKASFLFGICYFSNLAFISWLIKSQGLWSTLIFQLEVSIKVLNLYSISFAWQRKSIYNPSSTKWNISSTGMNCNKHDGSWTTTLESATPHNNTSKSQRCDIEWKKVKTKGHILEYFTYMVSETGETNQWSRQVHFCRISTGRALRVPT